MSKKDEYADLPLVPESVLKRRHDLDELKSKQQAKEELLASNLQRRNNNKGGGRNKGRYIKGPNTFLAIAKSRRNHEIRYKRVMKKGMMKRASNKKEMKTKEVPIYDDRADDDNESMDETQEKQAQKTKTVTYQSNSVGANMVFVVRTREDSGSIPRLIYQVLARFRLKKPFQGVFLKYTDVVRKQLHLIEPWVIYGKPSLGMIQDLLVRRSFGTSTKQGSKERVPISDNVIIEQELGNEHGILCIEDMIQEIYNAGESFNAVTKFLWPFQLTCPRSKFQKDKLGHKQGKDYGDKGTEIDTYIEQML